MQDSYGRRESLAGVSSKEEPFLFVLLLLVVVIVVVVDLTESSLFPSDTRLKGKKGPVLCVIATVLGKIIIDS